MNKLYLFIGAAIILLAAFYCGMIIGISKCQANIAQKDFELFQNNQQQLLKEKRIINETVYKTAAGDVRRILRDKYTIAE